MPTLNHKRRSYLPDRKRKPTSDQSFYNSTAWRKASKAAKQRQPLCEVSLALDVIAESEVTDHIIARSFGGADFREENLMRMTRAWHDKKSGMETRGLFLRTINTIDGKIPADRSEVIEALTKPTGGGSEPFTE